MIVPVGSAVIKCHQSVSWYQKLQVFTGDRFRPVSNRYLLSLSLNVDIGYRLHFEFSFRTEVVLNAIENMILCKKCNNIFMQVHNCAMLYFYV